MDHDQLMIIIISISTFISMISVLAGCLCCRRRVIKNELLGLEGLVKIKNPDDNVSSSVVSVEPKPGLESDIRRSSNAPHRSLPDIPSDPIGDTNCQLYATVGDKVLTKPQATSSLKKQASVSQHSSMSQADDVSSPYARVMSPPHSYDKVRHTEHPYAQLNAGPTSLMQVTIEENVNNQNSISRHESNESLVNIVESVEIPAASAIAGRIAASQELPYMTPPITQLTQQNFSGDSQDSSKGYTSISVREPLANIIAQTNQQNAILRRRDISDSHYATVSDDSDEMYAAIDDPNNQGELYTSGSETYAQIQAPNAFTVSAEVNTIPSSIRLSHEVGVSITSSQRLHTNSNTLKDDLPVTNPSENLKASMHSRQASSSSCTSSMGNLGSPKPEKRQANSPLPPPPTLKSSVQSPHHASTTNVSSSSVRNSIVINKSISKENLVIDNKVTNSGNEDNVKKKQSPSKDLEGMYAKVMKKNKLSNFPSQNSSPILLRKTTNIVTETVLLDSEINISDSKNNSTHTSPSKDSIKPEYFDNSYETIDKRRARSNSYDNKDPGYETIPGDSNKFNMNKSFGDFSQINQKLTAPVGALAQGIQRVSQKTIEIFQEVEKYTTEPGFEGLPDIKLSNHYGYQLAIKTEDDGLQRTISEYDPNYEVLRLTKNILLDDGYAKVLERNQEMNTLSKINDGYRSIKKVEYTLDSKDNSSGYRRIIHDANNDGYSSIKHKKNHDYASIKETNKQLILNNNIEDDGSDIYSIISNTQVPDFLGLDNLSHNYSTIDETQSLYPSIHDIPNLTISAGPSGISDTKTTPSSDSNSDSNIRKTNEKKLQKKKNYESLADSESDPNYESVKYLNIEENPYERLHNENSISPDTSTLQKAYIDTKMSLQMGPKSNSSAIMSNYNLDVGDYFQV